MAWHTIIVGVETTENTRVKWSSQCWSCLVYVGSDVMFFIHNYKWRDAYPRIASPQTSFGVRSGEKWMRDEQTSKDVCGETNPQTVSISFNNFLSLTLSSRTSPFLKRHISFFGVGLPRTVCVFVCEVTMQNNKRISTKYWHLPLLNPFAPEPPVTARADPGPFLPFSG